MTAESNAGAPPRRALRLWPGVVLAALLGLSRYVLPVVAPELVIVSVLAGLAGGALVLLWWLFFSRARWSERLGAFALMLAAVFATARVADRSIATGGMGMLPYLLAIPGLALAFVAWAVVTRNLPERTRRATMVATILLACAPWALVRTGGVSSDFDNDLAWRWTATPEERLLARSESVAATPVPAGPSMIAPLWPGFRGPQRDGRVAGTRIRTDWSAVPPVELWRMPIGPGWSSVAVDRERLYTQEQRGEDEVVACYRAATGEPVWKHRDATRFWESNAGAGPRATPTLANGRVYSLGATGIVNALDAGDGSVVWSRDAAADTGAKVPIWGFAGSPLVLDDDLVIVAASGTLAAYELASGAPRWTRELGGEGYSSPQFALIGGVPQVLQLSGSGLTSVAPADGAVLWTHEWSGYPIVQPGLTDDGDVLISVSDRGGLRRLAVAHAADGWTCTARWTSLGLKPYFNDFVVHAGHAFGFDGGLLACIDLADGRRAWKDGRYGDGQLVLLSDQDVLLVVGEEGELALVRAAPDGFTELARLPALEGKTWNHPVLAGDLLLVRNGEEMAAFRLPLAP